MPDRKRYITIGGTVAAIAGIGFFMQNGQSSDEHVALNSQGMIAQQQIEISEAALTSSAMQELAAAEAAPVVPAASEPVSAPMETAALSEAPIADTAAFSEPNLAAADDMELAPPPMQETVEAPAAAPEKTAAISEPVIAVEPEQKAESGPETTAPAACKASMTAETMAAALVKLNLVADCLPNERVTFEHAGMKFNEATDATGMLEIVVPALEENAVFNASFINGETVSASTIVGSLAFYDRAAVQSKSEAAVSLHALEYGADYADDGHVWAGSAGGIEKAATGKGGFVISLGDITMDDALVAEIYTFPTGIAQENGDVELSVEIEVTEMNCGRSVQAQSLQTTGESGLSAQTLNLTMPDCDAVGDFLVLKNLVDDLKVARN